MLKNNIQKTNEIVVNLKALYRSFDKFKIKAYTPLKETISKVIIKANNHENLSAWSNKLVMYLQAQIVLKNIPITKEQDKLINSLSEQCKNTNLNYVYLAPIYDQFQFN